eukprot:Nk52_evm59s1360 gene=Nk52_evmTU59s1360
MERAHEYSTVPANDIISNFIGNSEVVESWPLTMYARYHLPVNPVVTSSSAASGISEGREDLRDYSTKVSMGGSIDKRPAAVSANGVWVCPEDEFSQQEVPRTQSSKNATEGTGLLLCLLKCEHLVIYSSRYGHVYENHALWCAHEFLKAEMKSPNMITFVQKLPNITNCPTSNDCRTFRVGVALSKGPKQRAEKRSAQPPSVLKDIFNKLSSFFSISYAPSSAVTSTSRHSSGTNSESRMSNSNTQSTGNTQIIPNFSQTSDSLKENIIYPSQRDISGVMSSIPLPKVAMELNNAKMSSMVDNSEASHRVPSLTTGSEIEDALTPNLELRQFMRLCLMDPNFPQFVRQVNRELKKL